MKKLAKKEFYIGLSVIAAILILIIGIEYLKGINIFRPANFYIAYYDNVAGLEVSAPVTINGYKVGQVREINFNYEKPGKTEVLLALNKNLHLPEDSKAFIGSSLLGEGFVEIDMGTSTQMIPVGGTVQTEAKGGLMDAVTNSVVPQVSTTLATVDKLLRNLDKIVADPALSQSITRLDGITDNVLQASNGLNGIMNNNVPAILNNANGLITGAGGLVNGVNTSVGNLNSIISNVDNMSQNLNELSAQLKALPLAETMENVNQTVSNLEAFSAQLKNQNSTLGKLMNDPALYNSLNRVALSVDSLILDIKKNPKRYINIKLL